MKRRMMYFLFVLALCGACGKGDKEVSPTENPKEEIVVKDDTVKQDSLPPITEIPCEKDSTPIVFEKVDIAMGIIKELAPKDPSKPYDYPLLHQPFYIIINSAENELYKKLVTQEGKPIPAVDFEKNSLVVAGFTNVNGGFIENQNLTRVCKEGKMMYHVLVNQASASAAFTPINFSFLIPKVADNTPIKINISFKNN